MELQKLKAEIDAGECKQVNLPVPKSIIDKIEAYQKLYRTAMKERKPTRIDCIIMIMSDGIEGLEARMQQLQETINQQEQQKV